MDLYSREIVSYTIYDHPVLNMVTEMPDKTFKTIPDGTNLALHSDPGWHCQHKQYQRMLKSKDIRHSMSRKGNCLDNAVIENFFGPLKSELLYLQKFESIGHLRPNSLTISATTTTAASSKAKLEGLPPAIRRQQALSAA
ncbi:MAG: DDE-type integrase/transposase/recombinase [Oscillospiraceae bacterium]